MALGWTVGIDVGGTFTDAIAKHRDGRTRVAKVASTPEGSVDALLEAFEELLEPRASGPRTSRWSSTARRSPRTRCSRGASSRVVLLATEGFRDVMAFRNGIRPVLYDLRQPSAERARRTGRRLEVRERVSGVGDVVEELTDAEIDRVVEEVGFAARKPWPMALLFSYCVTITSAGRGRRSCGMPGRARRGLLGDRARVPRVPTHGDGCGERRPAAAGRSLSGGCRRQGVSASGDRRRHSW